MCSLLLHLEEVTAIEYHNPLRPSCIIEQRTRLLNSRRKGIGVFRMSLASTRIVRLRQVSRSFALWTRRDMHLLHQHPLYFDRESGSSTNPIYPIDSRRSLRSSLSCSMNKHHENQFRARHQPANNGMKQNNLPWIRLCCMREPKSSRAWEKPRPQIFSI